jgi:[mycofactocin precursor peptide]-tyrosine decarboxylase / 3-amino-5-[(4-hydroxyphenyl)methyl]-4,4-dimethylpyrrolidin-2-one synthase
MSADLRELDPFGPKTREPTQPVIHTGDTCGAGRHVCSISVQGDVNPCSFLGPDFETGNVRDVPFEVIWRTGHAMKRMRTSGEFRGGCRARALRLAGSVDAADPWLTEHEGGCAHPSANVELVGSRLTALPLC